MIPRFFVTLCVLVAVGAAWTWREAHRANVARASLVQITKRRASAGAALNDARARLAGLTTERASLQADFDRLARAPGRSVAARNTVPAARAFPNPFAVIHDDPALQTQWFATRRAALATTYRPLFRALRRSEADLIKFEELAIRREETNMDLSATMWARKLAKTDPALIKAEAQAQKDYETAVAELLGPGDAEKSREYERTLPARKIVTALAGTASIADEPLDFAQAEKMTELLVGLSGRNVRTGTIDVQMIDWNAADAAARNILSAKQLELFQTVEPEDGFNLYTFRFGSRVASLTNQAKRSAAAMPAVSAPANGGK